MQTPDHTDDPMERLLPQGIIVQNEGYDFDKELVFEIIQSNLNQQQKDILKAVLANDSSNLARQNKEGLKSKLESLIFGGEIGLMVHEIFGMTADNNFKVDNLKNFYTDLSFPPTI